MKLAGLLQRLVVAALGYAVALSVPACAASTLLDGIPAPNAPMASLPIAQQFQRAKSDINNILGMYPGTTPPASPTVGQLWRNTGATPNQISVWDGAQWVLAFYLDASGHTFYPAYLGAASILNSYPVTVSWSGGVATIGLNIGSNFAVSSNALHLAPIASGSLIANAGAGSAEPTASTPSAWFDRWCSSTNDTVPYRSGGTWACLGLLGTAHTWSATQAFGAITVTTLNGVSFPSSGTSGGIPYFSSSSAIASSGLLGANGVVIGGGAGAAPSTIAVGTAGYALISNGASAPSMIGYVPSGTGAVTRTWQDKASDFLTLGDFGISCNGSGDKTAAIQNAWNEAAKQHKNLKVTGSGPVCDITTLNWPLPSHNLPTPGETQGWSLLVGDSGQAVTLRSSVTGTNCAINVAGVYSSIATMIGSFGGFGIEQLSGTKQGYALCVSGFGLIHLDNLRITGFTRGIYAIDVIRLDLTHSWIYNNIQHVYGANIAHSYPNLWNIKSNWLWQADQYAIFLQNPDQINIIGNDLSSNGLVDGLAPATIYVFGNPLNGQTGVNVSGNYFEQNNGNAELFIDQNSGTQDAVHAFTNNTINRNVPSAGLPGLGGLLEIIGIANNGTGHTTVNVGGQYFLDFGGYSGSGNYLTAATPATTNYTFICSGNDYTTTGLMPAGCRKPVADSVMRSDGSNQFVGFGSIDLSKSGAVGTSRLAFANLAQGSALSVLGVTGNAGADNASIAAGSDSQIMRRNGTAVGFGSIDISQANAVGTSKLRLLNGGTNTDLSATGGASQVLKQVNPGAAITVAQLACSDLSNGATGCSTATGTSGATIPLLNGTNTWSGVQTFGDGDMLVAGSSSGTLQVRAAAAAGTSVVRLPAGSTDFSATGGTSQFVKQASVGAALTVARPACADLSDAAASCSTDATNASNISSGTVAVARGGTGLGSGTSGGILGYTASGTLASSAALTQNGVVLGGGAGAVPTSTSAGTTGLVLTGVTGGAPTFQTAGITLLNTLTASNSTTLDDTTSITATYDYYYIELENVVPATNAVKLIIQVSQNAGSSWLSTSYLDASANTDGIYLTGTVDNTAGAGISGVAYVWGPNRTDNKKFVRSFTAVLTGAAPSSPSGVGFYNGNNSAINGLRFQMTSGNISSGKIRIYGMRTS